MAGVAFTLHFGVFHLLSVFWQRASINAPQIMNAPILASSLSDFWGRRWNLAFRDVSHIYVFRPTARRFGVTAGTMAAFLVSGIVHDLVISVGAGSGFGLPTLYFVVQGVGVLVERSRLGKNIGIGKPVSGRLYCALFVLAPLGLLFHRGFVEQIIVPMLTTIGTI
jgi:D-alanyl-lipoteichoic acid acyltransferase DltB (MBOAT superfamily)